MRNLAFNFYEGNRAIAEAEARRRSARSPTRLFVDLRVEPRLPELRGAGVRIRELASRALIEEHARPVLVRGGFDEIDEASRITTVGPVPRRRGAAGEFSEYGVESADEIHDQEAEVTGMSMKAT